MPGMLASIFANFSAVLTHTPTWCTRTWQEWSALDLSAFSIGLPELDTRSEGENQQSEHIG